jgi:F-type H+-transporting ATPase subunit delta
MVAEVITVKALSADQLTKIQSIFEKVLGNKLLLTAHHDANILGGMIVRSGDMLFDASISRQLQKLTQQITD